MTNTKLKNLYEKAGFSTEAGGSWPTTIHAGTPLDKLVKLVIEECAVAAEQHSRTYSDGDAGSGSFGAARAVRFYGESLFK